MIKNVLSGIGGIGLYGVISICIFFAIFTVAVVRALSLKKSDVESARMLPLEDGTERSADETDFKGD